MHSVTQAALSPRVIRWLFFLLLATLAFIASLMLAPSAKAVNIPVTPNFTMVEKKCTSLPSEFETHPDGVEIVTNPDGTTEEKRKTKRVEIKITKCEWVERKITTGQGVFKERPELSDRIPCFALPHQGLPLESLEELCGESGGETWGDGRVFPSRSKPSFSDPDAAQAYVWATWAPGNRGDQVWEAVGGMRQIIDPSTVSELSIWPCHLTTMGGSSPSLKSIDNLSIDEISWARFINYKLTLYNKGSITYRSPETINSIIKNIEKPTRVDAKGVSLTNQRYISTAEWLSCKDALNSGGAVQIRTVRVSCPVYYSDREVDGPYGRDLPALADKKKYDSNSVRSTVAIPKVEFTNFGSTHWKTLIQPRSYSNGAMEAISLVQSCGSMTSAPFRHQLPYLGNYDLKAKLHYTTCSYSLPPGFNNNAYFGGCSGTPTSKPIQHTIHAGCDGRTVFGAAPAGALFDAATCFNVTCRWTNTSSSFIYGKDAPGVAANAAHFPNEANIPLRPNPSPPGARPDGTALLWDGSLNRMIVRDTLSSRQVGSPVSGPDKKFSVFQIDPQSSPWNPRVPKNKPNHEKQWFKAIVNETKQANPLVVIPNGLEPKNVPEDKRFQDWNNLNINVYQASRDGGSLQLRFHRVETWNVPLRLGSTAEISEYRVTPGPVRRERREPTLTCSTRWSAINYVGNRLQAPNTAQ